MHAACIQLGMHVMPSMCFLLLCFPSVYNGFYPNSDAAVDNFVFRSGIRWKSTLHLELSMCEHNWCSVYSYRLYLKTGEIIIFSRFEGRRIVYGPHTRHFEWSWSEFFTNEVEVNFLRMKLKWNFHGKKWTEYHCRIWFLYIWENSISATCYLDGNSHKITPYDPDMIRKS